MKSKHKYVTKHKVIAKTRLMRLVFLSQRPCRCAFTTTSKCKKLLRKHKTIVEYKRYCKKRKAIMETLQMAFTQLNTTNLS